MGAAEKVWFDAKTKNYEHENGKTIPAYDIRTLPQHRKEVLKLAGYENGIAPADEIIENENQAELEYVARILG